MTKLKAPAGTDEANVGEERFKVGDDGTIDVPPEDVEGLVKVGGFTVVDPATEPSTDEANVGEDDGLVPLAGAPGSGVSFAGQSYTADDTGALRVPAHAVAELLLHGFTLPEA